MIINILGSVVSMTAPSGIQTHMFEITESDYNLIKNNPDLLRAQFVSDKPFVTSDIYYGFPGTIYIFDISPNSAWSPECWGIIDNVNSPIEAWTIVMHARNQNNPTLYPIDTILNFELIPPTSPTTTFTFNAVAGISSVVHQEYDVTTTGTITYTSSVTWLDISQQNLGGNIIRVYIQPNATISTVGQYTGTVLVYDNSILIQTINIIYNIEDYVQIQAGYGGIQFFTLEPDYFKINTLNGNTYFQFDTEINCYNFNSNSSKNYTINQKIIPFQGKAKINLGKTIHRLMDRFSEPNNTFFQYTPTEFVITVKEINFTTGAIIRQLLSNTFTYCAGIDPKGNSIGSPITFFHFNNKPSRVTKNSSILLNFLCENNIELQTYVNNQLVTPQVVLSPVTYEIVTIEKLFDTYNIGDVIRYELWFNGTDLMGEKTYYVFPAGKYSNIITWENEFLLQTKLECTGVYTISSDFEFQTQKSFQNLVEQIEILDTTKENKLTINTGWILATDIDDIESLMRAKRVWIGPNNIALRPIGKKMINQDSERELIEFTLEFTINRKTDAETYSL